MADTRDFDSSNNVDTDGGGGCFLQLLNFSDHQTLLGHEYDELDNDHYSVSCSKMLCSGSSSSDFVVRRSTTALISGGGGVTCSDSSSTSNPISASTINRKRNRPNQEIEICCPVTSTGGGPERKVGCKKSMIQKPEVKTGHAKVRKNKEKLGERILALQQLVSPFGKTDTASVLHEVMGYIKFLHDQVTVLCSPYLQSLSSDSFSSVQPQLYEEGGENGHVKKKEDLRSSGLCLVPVESTIHLANNNGADFWSPAMAYKSIYASKAKH